MKTIHTADFYFKAPSMEAFSGRGESATYIIEVVIKLPTATFEAFRHNLLERQSCIADNVDLMYIDEAGTWHCIAIVAPDTTEQANLVQSSGYDYARYTALVSRAAIEQNRKQSLVFHGLQETQELLKRLSYSLLPTDGVYQLSSSTIQDVRLHMVWSGTGRALWSMRTADHSFESPAAATAFASRVAAVAEALRKLQAAGLRYELK